MFCTIMILLSGWCRMRMRPAPLVSYAFLYTTNTGGSSVIFYLKLFIKEICNLKSRTIK